MSRVLVLDVGYRPINVTSVRRAVVLLLMEKAEVVEHDERVLRAETLVVSYPAVIRLTAYVRIPYHSRRRITRRAVLARDQFKCQYCSSTSDLTIDHVVPKVRGGEHDWPNVVTACWPCNRRKGDRLPHEAGMKLLRKPTRPSAISFVFITVPRPPVSWEQYLFR